ncbi:MAG: DUF4139 domain-containing protein [Phycisphaerae bacterium]|jgi:hypothetical protein|nr:DUF4139 domain-containing protein [Phycisphaerae bacterium]
MNAKHWIVIVLVAVATAGGSAAAADKEGVSCTIYNGGYGVVREIRNLEIDKKGLAKFTDVASRIDATTVHFKSITDPKAKLLEQNYQYDLVSADKLLKKYIDRKIQVVCEGKTYSGGLLSFDTRQIVLREASGGIVMVQRPDNVRDIRFSALPGGLLTRPTLVWLVATEKPGKHLAEVTYQTSGVSWHAEYVAVLNGDDTELGLTGWVSFQNNSGKTYTDAKLKFIAGDVRRVQTSRPASAGAWGGVRAKASSAPMVEKAFFEYHMYTLPRPSTVADNEVKQLEMFAPAKGVKVNKRYLYNPLGTFRWNYGSRYTNRSYGASGVSKKVNVFIEFENSKDNNLGIPLPAGKVRVYKQDPDDGALEFIGEERIDHTPKDEELSLRIGNAFDIVGERKQTNFRVESGRHWIQETIEIKVRNHKKEAVTVRCKEPLYRWVNWKITAKSHEFTKLDARTIAFDVKIAPDKEAKITYTVDYTW